MLGIAMVSLVAACAGYVALNELRSPAASSGEPVEIVIEDGASTGDIATQLAAEGLIRQPALFVAMVRFRDLDGKLQAGRFTLSPTMSMSEILIALQSSRSAEAQFTIREGLRLEEIASVVGRTGVIDELEFLSIARNGDAFKSSYFLLSGLPDGATLEGYLFPDTYRIASTTTPTDVVTLMLERFVEQYSTVERDVQVPNVSVHQVVTMASIIQREAVLASEMPQISAVFWNRLKPENAAVVVGRLGADPTVQYALGYSDAEQTWWRKTLTVDDLKIASPYNTREQPGLPPGPIAAPGLAALRAAAQPAAGNLLFFVASCAKDGSHQFAEDFETFQVYEAEYLACQ
jgi:UPF0755 protein